MSKNIFITGTDTDIGKTYVSALIVKALHKAGKKVAYYKAAMSGNDRRDDGTLIPGDAILVKTESQIDQPLEEMCPYVYEKAYSPHFAAQIEGNPVQMEVVKAGFEKVCNEYDYVTMEGSGGILCPLTMIDDNHIIWLEDVIKELSLGCLIVADAGLGTINHVVLTVDYLRSKNIDIKGIIFNNYEADNILHNDNYKMCELRTKVPILVCVSKDDKKLNIDIDRLLAIYE